MPYGGIVVLNYRLIPFTCVELSCVKLLYMSYLKADWCNSKYFSWSCRNQYDYFFSISIIWIMKYGVILAWKNRMFSFELWVVF